MQARSFRDYLTEFSESVFVGRIEQLELFTTAISADRPPFLILGVSGPGGVGKTTLLERFRSRAKKTEVLSALTNERQPGVLETLEYFAAQLRLAGEPLKKFEERYDKFQEMKAQVASDPAAPTGMVELMLQGALRLGLRTLHSLPLAGVAADAFLTPQTEARAAHESTALLSYLARRFRSKRDHELLLDTVGALTRAFVESINPVAAEKRIALMFDSYEKTAPIIELWLLELLAGKFGDFSGKVIFVIAGRYPLGQGWTRYQKPLIRKHEPTYPTVVLPVNRMLSSCCASLSGFPCYWPCSLNCLAMVVMKFATLRLNAF